MVSDIDNVKEAVLRLAKIVEDLAWRVSTEEERKSLYIVPEIRKILEG